jgi:hypothetical protein
MRAESNDLPLQVICSAVIPSEIIGEAASSLYCKTCTKYSEEQEKNALVKFCRALYNHCT